MKVFWVKVTAVLVAALFLVSYQSQAHTLAVVSEAMKNKEAEINRIITETEKDAGKDSEAETSADDPADAAATPYRDGTYTGKGIGYSGDITVSVTVKDGWIKAIDVVGTSDDAAYLTRAEQLITDIIDRQTTEGVDAVSGATYSSNGILDAVDAALNESIG